MNASFNYSGFVDIVAELDKPTANAKKQPRRKRPSTTRPGNETRPGDSLLGATAPAKAPR
jgi:hypothetical protein